MTEQCTCGIIFTAPMLSDDAFLTHVTNGTHKACLLIEVCGPCFMGLCKGCDKVRRSDVQRWKCYCMHDYPMSFDDSVATVDHLRQTWSEWLESGRKSSVLNGTEEPVNDGTDPIKEI